MLERLHNCKTGVIAVVLPYEGCMDCTFVNPKGIRQEWLDMWDWSVYNINMPEGEDCTRIINIIKNNDLTEEDIQDTGLGDFCRFANNRYGMELKDVINKIHELDLVEPYSFYVMDNNDGFKFYRDYQSLLVDFEDYFMSDMTTKEAIAK